MGIRNSISLPCTSSATMVLSHSRQGLSSIFRVVDKRIENEDNPFDRPERGRLPAYAGQTDKAARRRWTAG